MPSNYQQKYNGNVYIKNLTVDTESVASQTFTGNTTFGDNPLDTIIQNGRYATGSAAGAAISLGASYTYGEGTEERWTVTSFTGINGDFTGKYWRAQSDIDSEYTIYGAHSMAVANGADVAGLQGLFAEAYTKGDTAETIAGGLWGIHGEVGWDASRANATTLTTGAAPLMGKVLSGKVDDYTKIHGVWLQFGDMDGGSRTYGDGIHMIDSPDEAGTSVMTNGINIAIGTTTGVLVAGSATDAFKTATGTFTRGLNIGGTVTTGILIGTTTTGISIGAATNALVTTASTTDAIKIHTTTGSVLQGTASSTNAYFLDAPTGSMAVDTTIAGQVVGTINCVIKCKFASTDFYLYGYAGKPTA